MTIKFRFMQKDKLKFFSENVFRDKIMNICWWLGFSLLLFSKF